MSWQVVVHGVPFGYTVYLVARARLSHGQSNVSHVIDGLLPDHIYLVSAELGIHCAWGDQRQSDMGGIRAKEGRGNHEKGPRSREKERWNRLRMRPQGFEE